MKDEKRNKISLNKVQITKLNDQSKISIKGGDLEVTDGTMSKPPCTIKTLDDDPLKDFEKIDFGG